MRKSSLLLCLMLLLASSAPAQTAPSAPDRVATPDVPPNRTEASAASDGSALRVVHTPEGYQISEGDQAVLFYQVTPKSLNGQYARNNYIHPLMGLHGETLTEDFPVDHLHHRGVFWTWHQILVKGESMGDGWACKDILWDIADVRVPSADPDSAAIETTVYWKSPQWQKGEKAFVKENATIRVYKAAHQSRAIDFTIRLLALEDDVKIGGSADAKGYGGFTARIPTPLEAEFIGETGRLTPQVTSVEGGGWMTVLGKLDGRPYGLAIFDHPSNPGYPQRWILRQSDPKQNQRTNMQNPAFPGREPVSLPTDRPLVLRYRLLIHEGADLPTLFAAYAKTTE